MLRLIQLRLWRALVRRELQLIEYQIINAEQARRDHEDLKRFLDDEIDRLEVQRRIAHTVRG